LLDAVCAIIWLWHRHCARRAAERRLVGNYAAAVAAVEPHQPTLIGKGRIRWSARGA
jgi:hypothetical protein